MYAVSSGVKSRNSSTVPTFQPFRSNRSIFALRIVVIPKSGSTYFDNAFRCLGSLLFKDLHNNHCIRVRSIDNPPGHTRIRNPELMASWPHIRHRSRLRQGQAFAFLQPPQQETCLDTGHGRKRRCFHLSVKPDERFILRTHFNFKSMSDMTLRQGKNHADQAINPTAIPSARGRVGRRTPPITTALTAVCAALSCAAKITQAATAMNTAKSGS